MNTNWNAYKVLHVLNPLSGRTIGAKATQTALGLSMQVIKYDGNNKPIDGTEHVDLWMSREQARELARAIQKALDPEFNPAEELK